MRTMRLEESFDEAVLPEDIQLDTNFYKIAPAMEKFKLCPKEKYDSTHKGFESYYREDLR